MPKVQAGPMTSSSSQLERQAARGPGCRSSWWADVQSPCLDACNSSQSKHLLAPACNSKYAAYQQPCHPGGFLFTGFRAQPVTHHVDSNEVWQTDLDAFIELSQTAMQQKILEPWQSCMCSRCKLRSHVLDCKQWLEIEWSLVWYQPITLLGCQAHWQ